MELYRCVLVSLATLGLLVSVCSASFSCPTPPSCGQGYGLRNCVCVRCGQNQYWERKSGHAFCKHCSGECSGDLKEVTPCGPMQNRVCHCDRGFFCESKAQYSCRRCHRCPAGTFSSKISLEESCQLYTDCSGRSLAVISNGTSTEDQVCASPASLLSPRLAPPAGSVETSQSSAPPAGSVETSQSSAPPAGSVENSQSSAPPAGSAKATQSSAPPDGSVENSQSSVPPAGSVETSQSSVPPAGSVETSQSSAPPAGSVETSQSSAPPAGSVETSQSSAPPAGSAETSQSSAPPDGSAKATQSSAPPDGSAETSQSSAPPDGSAKATQSSAPPDGSAKATQSSAPPAGSVETTQSNAPPDGSVETTQSSVPPAGSAKATQSSAPPAGSAKATQSSAPQRTIPVPAAPLGPRGPSQPPPLLRTPNAASSSVNEILSSEYAFSSLSLPVLLVVLLAAVLLGLCCMWHRHPLLKSKGWRFLKRLQEQTRREDPVEGDLYFVSQGLLGSETEGTQQAGPPKQQVTVDHSASGESVSNTVGSIYIYSPRMVVLGANTAEQKEEVQPLGEVCAPLGTPQQEQGPSGSPVPACVQEEEGKGLSYPVPVTSK